MDKPLQLTCTSWELVKVCLSHFCSLAIKHTNYKEKFHLQSIAVSTPRAYGQSLLKQCQHSNTKTHTAQSFTQVHFQVNREWAAWWRGAAKGQKIVWHAAGPSTEGPQRKEAMENTVTVLIALKCQALQKIWYLTVNQIVTKGDHI